MKGYFYKTEAEAAEAANLVNESKKELLSGDTKKWLRFSQINESLFFIQEHESLIEFLGKPDEKTINITPLNFEETN